MTARPPKRYVRSACRVRLRNLLTSGLFYCWYLLRNNNTEINLQMFTSSYGSGRFAVYNHAEHPLRFFSPIFVFLVDLGVLV